MASGVARMHSDFMASLLKGPVPLSPDNYTPRVRTPWGGDYIGRFIKNDVVPESVGRIIGESWDFSCEPTFASQVVGTKWTLFDLITAHPKEVLSEHLLRQQGAPVCELLVKLIDAQDDLSVQVHPTHDDPALASDECGKSESWLVLHAEPGAGIYLGFKQGLAQERFAAMLKNGEDLRPFLQFVPVRKGDCFDIPPGTCHAIGKGVTLLEPQQSLFAKKAKTYRMYDWGRRYNARGESDATGTQRELHITESLGLVRSEEQCGEAFLDQLRSTPDSHTLGAGVRVASYTSSPYYRIHYIEMKARGVLSMQMEDAFGALIATEGRFSIQAATRELSYWQKGQPALLPSSCFPLSIEALTETVFTVITPTSAKLEWSSD